ncbi:MAG TPA: hypothetical protein VNB94_13140 [Mycobacteriales bacterium]|nr:hypothetical protein [Mycobacteriales bacterium]
MRKALRSVALAGMTGALMVTAGWAGVGLVPVPTASAPTAPATGDAVDGVLIDDAGALPVTGAGAPARAQLGAGRLLVGAAKTSMLPRPDKMQVRFPGARWETDPAKCKTLAPEWYSDLPKAALNALDGIASAGSTWPENPSCIYQGGFGIGPTNPVKSFDTTLGLWVRSMAFSDGKQTIITTVIDGEGWLWDYERKCSDCGAKQIAAALAADPQIVARKVGVTPASHILHATHSHASPDFIGGWGFVPNWYMAQITDAIKSTAKQAVLSMEAARVETGELDARAFNNERRDTYRSAEESQLSWIRAVAANPRARGKNGGPRVIATLGAYAAHPTSFGTNEGVAHPDWPGQFEKALENRFGGIGLHFMTGLGNMSNAQGKMTGAGLAALIPGIGKGRPVDKTAVRIAQVTATSALTNVPLTALGTPGFFDRKFSPTPALVRTGKEPDMAPCISTSPQSVELPITAARIGDDIVFSAAPGEVFSNFTNTVKEKNAGRVTFPLAQANDALGYMPQSFEINPVSQQGLGLIAGGYVFVNYEDGYAIDRCVGDLMLEQTLSLLTEVKK